jgi:hypothetical protein
MTFYGMRSLRDLCVLRERVQRIALHDKACASDSRAVKPTVCPCITGASFCYRERASIKMINCAAARGLYFVPQRPRLFTRRVHP